MSDLESKIRDYREYRRMAEELEDMASAIADELKAMMAESGTEKMIVGEYRLTYTDVRRETLDQQKLEAVLGNLSRFKKVTTYKRFQVA